MRKSSFHPQLEQLEDRLCLAARALFWNPLGTSGNWNIAGAWKVGSPTGAAATSVPGFEDTVNFTTPGKDCTLDVDSTVNAFIELLPSTTTLTMGTHTLTVKKNDSNSEFDFRAGKIDFSGSDLGKLTLDAVQGSGYWGVGGQFLGSQGTVSIIDGGELRIEGAGTTWYGRTHFEIGDASGTTTSDLYVNNSTDATLDLGIGGDIDVYDRGILDFAQGAKFTVSMSGFNANTLSDLGIVEVQNSAGTAIVNMSIFVSGGGQLDIDYGKMVAGGYDSSGSVYQSAGRTMVRASAELDVVNRFVMDGGEFDLACVWDSSTHAGGTVTTQGEFLFDAGTVDTFYGVGNSAMIWQNSDYSSFDNGKITFGAGVTVKMRIDGTGSVNDYLSSPQLVLGGTLRITEVHPYTFGNGVFLLAATEVGGMTGSFAHMYLGTGTTLLTDSYNVTEVTASGVTYLDLQKK